MKLAFATSAEHRDLTPDDRWLAERLVSTGVEITATVWDDPEVRWARFDAVVIRSCWDYHLRLGEFGAWLGRLDRQGCAVWNPTRLLRWNSRKTYLEDLRGRGIEAVPTVYLPLGKPIEDGSKEIGRLMERLDAEELVIKPTVGASAYGAWTLPPPRSSGELVEARKRLTEMLAEHELMVQTLIREIMTAGEWSLIFFGGKLSHSVRKLSAPGDFRVQEELGGSSTLDSPPDPVVVAARRALAAVDGATLYARVDLVEVGGRGVLMELELIEPWLFFELEPASAERFRTTLERLS